MTTSFDLAAEVRDLAARRDIQRAVQAYMRGQDRLLPDVQRSAFHDDADVDCGLFRGGPDAYVKFAQGFLAQTKGSQHLIGQHDIRVDGDVAHGEVYFIAWHRVVEDGVDKDLIVAGRYIDRYENRNGGWKIAKRRELVDWARTDAPADSFLAQQPLLHRARQDARDFSIVRDWSR
jgi:SnoaL-like domain